MFHGGRKRTLEELHNYTCLPTPPFSHKQSLNYRCGCQGQHCFEEMQHTCSLVIWKFANSLAHRGLTHFLHFLEVGGRDGLTSTWPGSSDSPATKHVNEQCSLLEEGIIYTALSTQGTLNLTIHHQREVKRIVWGEGGIISFFPQREVRTFLSLCSFFSDSLDTVSYLLVCSGS